MIQAIENMNEFYKNIHIDFIHQAISIPGVAMRVCFNSITLLVDLVLFSTDTTKLVKHLFKTIQTKHVRKSLVMMQMLFIFGP